MRKRVKGGIEKNYCDKCGKLIYDLIPKSKTVELLGMTVPEYTMKKHNDYKIEYGCKKRGIAPGMYCVECHKTLYEEK